MHLLLVARHDVMFLMVSKRLSELCCIMPNLTRPRGELNQRAGLAVDSMGSLGSRVHPPANNLQKQELKLAFVTIFKLKLICSLKLLNL